MFWITKSADLKKIWIFASVFRRSIIISTINPRENSPHRPLAFQLSTARDQLASLVSLLTVFPKVLTVIGFQTDFILSLVNSMNIDLFNSFLVTRKMNESCELTHEIVMSVSVDLRDENLTDCLNNAEVSWWRVVHRPLQRPSLNATFLCATVPNNFWTPVVLSCFGQKQQFFCPFQGVFASLWNHYFDKATLIRLLTN